MPSTFVEPDGLAEPGGCSTGGFGSEVVDSGGFGSEVVDSGGVGLEVVDSGGVGLEVVESGVLVLLSRFSSALSLSFLAH